jgi:hypothetical protein
MLGGWSVAGQEQHFASKLLLSSRPKTFLSEFAWLLTPFVVVSSSAMLL